MKVLIWFLTLLVATILNTLLGYATGFKAGYLVLYIAVYFIARKLCNLWDEHKEAKKESAIIRPNSIVQNIPMPVAVSSSPDEIPVKIMTPVEDLPPIKFCGECGHKLLDHSVFCSNCGTRIIADIPLTVPHPDVKTSADVAIERLFHSTEFKSAYNALSDDQKERFFLLPDRELDAARVTYSVQRLVGQTGTIQQILEIYITIFSRIIVTHMSPERIAVTLNMRYSNILNAEQQYVVIAFTEAHINGMHQGFYIRDEKDARMIAQTARACQNSAAVSKKVSKAADYGFSTDNPIRVQSIPAEYSYLERLVYNNGQIRNIDRVAAVNNADGDMIDYFKITVTENGKEKQIALFLDGYSDSSSSVAPQGFHLK